MSCSDDEGESLVANVVSDYSLLDDNDEPISFSELPLIWDDTERLEGSKKEIGLHGTTDNGLQKIFEQVVAWKFDSSSAKAEIFVLSKKKNWIKLLKPRKAFENTVRTILITVHCLHFIKRNPETSDKVLWDYVAKVFSLYEPRPSQNDLVDHMNLVGEAVKRDEILTRSKVLITFLQEKPHENEVSKEEVGTKTMSSFIVDEAAEDEAGEDEADEEEEEFFESVCAICDNGGDILCCEGKCMRSFHATEEAGSDSACESLGFSEEQVRALATFECKNCQYKQHQCFICGELGSSDKSTGAKVFQCVTGTCGFFYHPHCVAEALRFKHGDETKDLEAKIAAGEPFMCPLHICHVCKELEPEDKNDLQMQFAVCRRCPRAYHRKCLPRKIAFEDDMDKNIVQRAWEGLMPNKILIYCLKHEIDDELATPIRNHIKFPDTDQKKKKQALDSICRDKSVLRERVDAREDSTSKKVVAKQSGTDKLSAGKRRADSSAMEDRLSMRKSLKKQKLENNMKVASNKTLAGKQKRNSGVKSKSSLGNQLYELCSRSSEPEGDISDLNQQRKTGKPVAKEVDNSLEELDADSKRRILSIVREAESSITLEDVARKHQAPSTHASSRHAVQSITLGKLEGATEALRTALKKLEEGSNLEDAKAVCEPRLLNQIGRWRNKLKVYLAPFLYGPRYTSFGRHFTKVEKLQLIVDKLHCYVQDGDMIVDFACGTNDFSCLVKEKLDQLGKNCGYKNYDIFPPKNDFNFEKRDWMTVHQRELPPGAKLIIGLNPPFGVNAALANKFIDKAIEFKPKLLILIVPRETLRLDEKKQNPYDLVWEDEELLRGKSFYLPGSVDVNDKQLEDWNVNAPPLYLWSRPDWTAKHKAIALENGHLSRSQQDFYKRDAPDGTPETHNLDDETCMVTGSLQDVKQPHEGVQVSENGPEAFGNGTGVKESHGHGKDQVNDTFEEVNKNNRKHGKDEVNDSFEEVNKNNRKRRNGRDERSSEERRSLPRHSSPSKSGSRSLGNHLSKHPEMHSHSDLHREAYQRHDNSYSSGSQGQLQRGHDGYHGDGTGRRNTYEEHFSNMEDRRALPSSHHSDYDFVVADERFTGYRDYHGGHTNVNGYGSLIPETNEGYGKEEDIRAQVRMFGHQDPDSFRLRDSYFPSASSVFPSSYGQHGPAVSSAYDTMNTSAMQRYAPRLDESINSAYDAMNTSAIQRYAPRLDESVSSAYNAMNTTAMQRYAPRLDELNHTRMNNPGPRQPPYAGMSGMYSPASRPQIPPDPLGFAPGPYRPYSQQSSSGWLNE